MTPTHEVNNGTTATEGPQYSIGDAGEVFKLMMSLIPNRLAGRQSLRAGAGNDGAAAGGGRAFDAPHDGPPDVGPVEDDMAGGPVCPDDVDTSDLTAVADEHRSGVFDFDPTKDVPSREGAVEVCYTGSRIDEAVTLDGETVWRGDGWFNEGTRLAVAYVKNGGEASPCLPEGTPVPDEFRGGLPAFVEEAEVLAFAKRFPGCGWSLATGVGRVHVSAVPRGHVELSRDVLREKVLDARLRADAARYNVPLPGDEARAAVPKVSAAEWALQDLSVDYLVDGLVVTGRPGFLAGPQKTCKTQLAVALAVHGATGTPVFGDPRFAIARPFRTWLMSMESGGASLRETAAAVAGSVGTTVAGLGDRLYVTTERRQVNHPTALAEIRRQIEGDGIELLIVDPFFVAMMLPPDAMKDAAVMYSAMNHFTDLCDATGCAVLFCHHTVKAKGKTFTRTELSDLSGAGVAEWMRQWVLVSRRSAFDPVRAPGRHELHLNYGNSTGQAGGLDVTVDERAADGSRAWAVSIDRPGSAPRHDDPDRSARDKATGKRRLEARNASIVAAVLAAAPGPLTAGRVKAFSPTVRVGEKSVALHGEKVKEALGKLVAAGQAEIVGERGQHLTYQLTEAGRAWAGRETTGEGYGGRGDDATDEV